MTEKISSFIKENKQLFTENGINKFFENAYYSLTTSQMEELAKVISQANIEFSGDQIFKEFSDYFMYSKNSKYEWAVQLLSILEEKFGVEIKFPQKVRASYLFDKLYRDDMLQPASSNSSPLEWVDTVEIIPWIQVKGGKINNILIFHFQYSIGQGLKSFVDEEVENYEDSDGELFRVIPNIGIGYNSERIKEYINGAKEYILNVVRQLIS